MYSFVPANSFSQFTNNTPTFPPPINNNSPSPQFTNYTPTFLPPINHNPPFPQPTNNNPPFPQPTNNIPTFSSNSNTGPTFSPMQPSFNSPINNQQSFYQAPGTDIHNGTCEVSILLYEDTPPLLHWTIFTEPAGFVLDVTRDDQTGAWTGRLMLAAFATPTSSRFAQSGMNSGKYVGMHPLGKINANNIPEFQNIARSIHAPTGPGENCQSWVRNVIGQATQRGMLSLESFSRAASAPPMMVWVQGRREFRWY